MSKKEENPRSKRASERPLEKLFAEGFQHLSRRYSQLESGWEKQKPYWNKKIREARHRSQQEYDLAILGKAFRENSLMQESRFLIHTSEFCWVVSDVEDVKHSLRSVVDQLAELGIIKKQIIETSEAVEKRERIFTRIQELWNGLDQRERDYKKLLIYQMR
jgi:hypothetical protein